MKDSSDGDAVDDIPSIMHLLQNTDVLRTFLTYYQRTHKPEYALHQSPENVLIVTSFEKPEKEELMQSLANEDEREVDFTVFDDPRVGAKWTASRWDRFLIRMLAWDLSNMPLGSWDKDKLVSRSPYDSKFFTGDEMETHSRAAAAVEWVKNELSPENWENSLIPDLLCIRADREPNGLDEEVDEPESTEEVTAGRLFVSLPSPLITDGYLSADNYPPGHPLPRQQA